MKTKSFIAITLSMYLLITCAYSAKTIFVPRDYAVIQDAIINAEDGDTVRVASGTYSSFKIGKNIRVIGEDRDTTIITGNFNNPSIRIPNRTNASIESFTIEEGGAYDYNHYGGIVVMDSLGVVIKNCVIRRNDIAHEAYGASGISVYASEVTILDCVIEDNVGQEIGGIYCSGNSSLTMKNTVVRNNKSTDTGGAYSANTGGLFSIDSSVQVEDCVFENNETERTGSAAAINAIGNGSLIMNRCRFAGNSGGELNAAVRVGDPIHDYPSDILYACMTDSVFDDNDRSDIRIMNSTEPIQISRCVFRRSVPDDVKSVSISDRDLIMDNCLFDGTGLGVNSIDNGVITNCTFVNCTKGLNVSYSWPGVIIGNCIFWNNDRDLGDCDTVTVTYSCIEDGYAGTGNITEDPEFVDAENGDYRLSSSSPCIDTGDNNAPGLGDKDLEGKPRKLDGGTSATVDMGCYEYPSILPSVSINHIDGDFEYGGEQTARIIFSIYDSDSSPANLEMEYSVDDGNNWEPASGSFSSTSPFSTSPLGVEYEFYWDLLADLGRDVYEEVLFRISPFEIDDTAGEPCVSDMFDLNTLSEIVHNRSCFTFNVAEDFIFPEETQSLVLRSWRYGSLDWSITDVPDWLDVTPDSGIMDPTGTDVDITLQTDGMSTGTYEAELTLNSTEAFNTPQIIKVTLNIGVVRTVTPDGALGIQETIDISDPGDIVKIMPGKYQETIVMAPDVSLVGTNMYKTVILGDGENPVITAEEIDSVVIKNLTLKRGSFGISCEYSYILIKNVWACYNYNGGFSFYKYSETSLKGCVATNNASTGLNLNSQSRVTVKNCLFAYNGYAGVQSINSPSTLTNCRIVNNAEYGVLARLAELTLKNCIVYGNGEDLDGCEVKHTCTGEGDETRYAWEMSNHLNPRCKNSKSPPGIIYVDASAVPDGDGTKEYPFQKIQDGIDAAWFGDTVLVAPGTYNEEVMMKHMVTLKGDEVSFPVINAVEDEGDGILCFGLTSAKVFNFKLSGCWDSIVTIGSSVEIENCEIEDSCMSGTASFYMGDLIFKNLLLSNNWGRGIDLWLTTDVVVSNCTVVGDDDWQINYGLFAYRSEPVIKNCVIWDNYNDLVGCTAIYSNISDGDPGTGNICADPLFVVGPLGGFYLSQTASGQAEDSPCVDAGSDEAAEIGLDSMTTRTDNGPDEGIVDMGYHYPYILRIYSVILEGNSVTLMWNQKFGKSYIVQWSEDMETWNDVPVGEVGNWTDPDISGPQKKFYRVLEQ